MTHVAVVLFCDVESETEAEQIAEITISRLLGPLPQMLEPVQTSNGKELPAVLVHEVREVGMAAGNGYLWTQPTLKAYPR
jgi:hypothetical protein